MAEQTDRRQKWIRVRMSLIGSLMIIGLLAVIGRVYYLQTVKREKLDEYADEQTSGAVELTASRGHILDRNGVELAVTTDVPSIYAHPHKVEKPRRAARRLSPHLNLEVETLIERLTSDSSFVWLERQVKPASAEAIGKLEVAGVHSVTEHKRYYPLGPRAGQLLGFVGIDGDGLEGVERMLDETLDGGSYELFGTRDAHGRTILSRNVPNLGKLQGDTVELTIDERIQHVAQMAVAEQVEKYDAAAGYGVVMKADSGEVLAVTNTPHFDPNRFQDFSSQDWRLRTLTDTFEPGSIFKPFILGAALEEETVSLNTVFDCEDGAIQIGKHTVRDSHAHEELDAAKIIQKSSNIGAYKIAKTIGKERTYEYIRSFGFGSRTGLGMRGEQPGLVWPSDRWAEVTFANVAFGQGLTATPMQMTTAMAAVANGGLLLEPRIVSTVRNPDGTVKRRTNPTLVRRVISERTARQVGEAMSLVTLEEGTGTNAALDNFTVAGKTGTAQKVDPKTHRYSPDKWVGSFIGFVPAEDPELVILVMIDEPKDTHYGGVVAAPAFKKIARKALAVQGILPADEQPGEREEGGAEASAAEPSKPADPEADAPRDGQMAGAATNGEPTVPAGATDAPAVPDFRGMTLREAVQKASTFGRMPDVEGWGRVVAQTPRPGAALGAGEGISLVLAPSRRVGSLSGTPATGGPESAGGSLSAGDSPE